MNILHGLTGSVASTLFDKFRCAYSGEDTTEYVFTQSSKHFIDRDIRTIGGSYCDEYEWMGYKTFNKVLHIELVKWADVFVIAPCSANTLAKIANGICDNLLTCVARAWDFEKKFIVAPAMNVKMMTHPSYNEHISKIKSWGITVVDPIEKKLFCGDVGMGAMANIEDIVKEIKNDK